MKVQVLHSIVQDMSVVKFNSLSDYSRCIKFLHNSNLPWVPLKYSSAENSASIRVDEDVLLTITKRFGIGYANTNFDGWTTGMR